MDRSPHPSNSECLCQQLFPPADETYMGQRNCSYAGTHERPYLRNFSGVWECRCWLLLQPECNDLGIRLHWVSERWCSSQHASNGADHARGWWVSCCLFAASITAAQVLTAIYLSFFLLENKPRFFSKSSKSCAETSWKIWQGNSHSTFPGGSHYVARCSSTNEGRNEKNRSDLFRRGCNIDDIWVSFC